jgi:O-antigen/teichoic acid export membrane protein
LTQQIHAVSAAGTSVLLPQISRRSKTETVSSIARAVSKRYVLMACAIILISVIFAMFGRDILQLWLRVPVSNSAVELFRYLTIAFAVLALNVVPHFVLLAVGRARLVATSNIAAGAISCVMMLWLTPLAGTDGVGYAKIAYGLITTAILVPVFVGLRFGK